MNWFNQFSCRVHDSEDPNIFKGIRHNPFFIIIAVIELLVTYLMVRGGNNNLLGSLFGTAPITFGQSLTCWILGAISLIVNFASKKLPIEPFTKLTKKFDLESEKQDELVNKFMEKAKGKYSASVNSYIEQQPLKFKNSLIE